MGSTVAEVCACGATLDAEGRCPLQRPGSTQGVCRICGATGGVFTDVHRTFCGLCSAKRDGTAGRARPPAGWLPDLYRTMVMGAAAGGGKGVQFMHGPPVGELVTQNVPAPAPEPIPLQPGPDGYLVTPAGVLVPAGDPNAALRDLVERLEAAVARLEALR